MYPFERFTEEAKKVLTLAQEEAESSQHSYIGTEHLLLALLATESEASRILGILGVEAPDVRQVLKASRESSASSHLLAYSNTPDRHTLEAWINAGVIGTVREVHNWTNRPFWPQGWQEYFKSGPPVPADNLATPFVRNIATRLFSD